MSAFFFVFVALLYETVKTFEDLSNRSHFCIYYTLYMQMPIAMDFAIDIGFPVGIV